MKQKITILFSLLLIAANSLLYGTEKSDSSKIYFENAFNNLKEILEEKLPPNFEQAVFISENAYHNNKFSYENFQKSIDIHLYCVKKLIEANDKSDSIDFNAKVNANGRFKMDDIRYLPKEKKELYRKALTNWAIFTYLTDTTILFPVYHLPFSYATHDPFGMKDWSNSQVINLLVSKEQKGNCFALTGLFKILSDRLNSEARICTAPQHIYIQHQDHKGDYYNVELATAGHPGDGLIQVLTYTPSDAIKSGIALRTYDKKQSIGLCLVNLAKSYEHKFQTKEDEFILRCAELVLKHDSLNLNALLLKQQVLDARVTNYATKNKVSDINRLKQDPKISKTVSSLEKHLALLYQLGYRQMPMDMQQMVLDGFRNEDNGSIRVNKNPSPFTTVKPKDPNDAQYWTLSHGAFPEVFEQKEQENYGHITFKTGTKKITTIDTASKTGFLIDPVAFAYDFGARMYDARLGIFTSVDPLSHKYPQWSPYSAFQNNPIIYIDIDGREVVPANARANAIFQLALTQTFGEEVAGVFQNAYTFKNRYSKLRSYSSIDTQSKEFKSAIKNIDDEETRQLAYQLAEAINNENINFVDALEDETAKSLDRGDAATQVGNYVFDFLNSGTGQPQNPSVVDLQGGATSTVSPSTVGSNAASYTAVSTEDISGTYTANTNREGYTISNDFKISNTSLNREQSQGFLRWLVAGSKAASTNPTTNLKAKEELRTSKPSFE